MVLKGSLTSINYTYTFNAVVVYGVHEIKNITNRVYLNKEINKYKNRNINRLDFLKCPLLQ